MPIQPRPQRFDRKKSHTPPPVKITNNAGRLEIQGMEAWYSYWRDPYHLMLTIPWWGFIGIVALGYILVNAFFALLYLLGGDSINGAHPNSFADAFFFSVQTFASIGYGVMSPKTPYAHIIVTLEAIASLFAIAVVTGLAFSRFSQPTARILFSKIATVAPFNGVPTLIMRCANKRRNYINEAQARLYFVCDEITTEGEFIRRFYDLQLLRDRNPSFALSWSIMHAIDETSPLYNMTLDEIEQMRGQLILAIGGIDSTVSYPINTRKVYESSNILWDHRFVDIFIRSSTGERYIDYTKFHIARPIDQTRSHLYEKDAVATRSFL